MKENKTIYAFPSVKVVRMAAKCGIMSGSLSDASNEDYTETNGSWNW